MSEGWDAKPEAAAQTSLDQVKYASQALPPLTDDDALRHTSVTNVTQLLRSEYLSHMLQRLGDYDQRGETDLPQSVLVPEDPEYQYVSECSHLVLRIEAEKSRVMVFLRAHYGVRFPELAMFILDMVLYAKVVEILGNSIDLTEKVDQLVELIPSQMLVVIISCASTTQGRELTSAELQSVLDACREMEHLEMAKQNFLEYIQCSMPLICPNLCALLDTGITSQLFAITGSVSAIAGMDPSDLLSLGAKRSNESGVGIRTAGFLSNCDLVANLPAPLRPKALRLLSGSVLKLARIDANRRAPSRDEGIRERKKCGARIRQWLDPPVVRGAGNVLYERRGRKKRRNY